MDTALVEGMDVSGVDALIVTALGLKRSTPEAVKKAPKLIGIRNEKGEIYRLIGAENMNRFLEAFVRLSDLCLDAQIYVSHIPSEKFYDAIFSVVGITSKEAAADHQFHQIGQ